MVGVAQRHGNDRSRRAHRVGDRLRGRRSNRITQACRIYGETRSLRDRGGRDGRDRDRLCRADGPVVGPVRRHLLPHGGGAGSAEREQGAPAGHILRRHTAVPGRQQRQPAPGAGLALAGRWHDPSLGRPDVFWGRIHDSLFGRIRPRGDPLHRCRADCRRALPPLDSGPRHACRGLPEPHRTRPCLAVLRLPSALRSLRLPLMARARARVLARINRGLRALWNGAPHGGHGRGNPCDRNPGGRARPPLALARPACHRVRGNDACAAAAARRSRRGRSAGAWGGGLACDPGPAVDAARNTWLCVRRPQILVRRAHNHHDRGHMLPTRPRTASSAGR